MVSVRVLLCAICFAAGGDMSVNLTPTLAQYQSQSSPASDRSEGGTNEVAYEPFEPPPMPAFAAYEPPMRGELERAHPSILTSKASSGHL